MSRWKHKTFEIRVGDNAVEVRGLTADERARFAAMPAEIEARKMPATDMPILIVQMGSVNPKLSIEEVRDMPVELLDACSEKVMEMTGMKGESEKKTDHEKKESSPPPNETPAA